MSQKPAIFIARKVFPEVVAHLGRHFQVDMNESDEVLPPAELIARLLGQTDATQHANIVLLGDAWLWAEGQRIAAGEFRLTFCATRVQRTC